MQERRPDSSIRETRLLRTTATVGFVASAIIFIDQLTKSWAERHFSDEPFQIVGSLQLSITYNLGAAFGLGAGFAPMLVAGAFLVAAGLVLRGQIDLNKGTLIGGGLALGGALGNLGDRVFRGHGGAVVDFIDLQWWPVFNLADVSVVIGAVAIAIWGGKRHEVLQSPKSES